MSGNTLTVMFSQWPNWRKVIDMILAHKFTNQQQEEKHILICYYKWTDEPILVNSQGQEIRSKSYCWGHATDPSSALQIALAGGIRPASTVDENNAIYHWCPSFYCRIDGSSTHASITKDRYVQQSINTIIHTRKYSQMNHRPFIFHGIGKSRQQTHYKVVQGGVGGEYTQLLSFSTLSTDTIGDGWSEVTLQLQWASQSRRWIVHLPLLSPTWYDWNEDFLQL